MRSVFCAVFLLLPVLVAAGVKYDIQTCKSLAPGVLIDIETEYFVAKDVLYDAITPTNDPDGFIAKLQDGLLCPFRCNIQASFVRHQRDEKRTTKGKWWAPVSYPQPGCAKLMSYDMIDGNTMNVCPHFLGKTKEERALMRSIDETHETFSSTMQGACGLTNALDCRETETSPVYDSFTSKNTFQIFRLEDSPVGVFGPTTPREAIEKLLGRDSGSTAVKRLERTDKPGFCPFHYLAFLVTTPFLQGGETIDVASQYFHARAKNAMEYHKVTDPVVMQEVGARLFTPFHCTISALFVGRQSENQWWVPFSGGEGCFKPKVYDLAGHSVERLNLCNGAFQDNEVLVGFEAELTGICGWTQAACGLAEGNTLQFYYKQGYTGPFAKELEIIVGNAKNLFQGNADTNCGKCTTTGCSFEEELPVQVAMRALEWDIANLIKQA